MPSLSFKMTIHFITHYTYNNALNNGKLMNEIIPDIPFIHDNDEWKIDCSGIVYSSMMG